MATGPLTPTPPVGWKAPVSAKPRKKTMQMNRLKQHDFYALCEWLKTEEDVRKMPTYVDIANRASDHFSLTIVPSSIKSAMTLLKIELPSRQGQGGGGKKAGIPREDFVILCAEVMRLAVNSSIGPSPDFMVLASHYEN